MSTNKCFSLREIADTTRPVSAPPASPATYEVSGQPGSAAAAIGLNALLGLSNAASDFFAPVIGFRPSYMQDIPTGSGTAANVGAVVALLGVAMTGPGGEVREDMKASEILARYVKGRVKEEFPSQFLDRTLTEIRLAARQRVPFAQKALKLLTRIEYRK